MKRLIAISVALALAAGSAFAETTVTWQGGLMIGLDLVRGANDYGVAGGPGDTAIVGRGLSNWARIGFTATRDSNIGMFGAMARVTASPFTNLTGTSQAPLMEGHVWWRPHESFRFGLGRELRTILGGGAMDWLNVAFVDNAGILADVGLLQNNQGGAALSPRHPFMGDGMYEGLAMAFTPMGDSLHIHVGLPYRWGATYSPMNAVELMDTLRGVWTRAYFNLDGGGRIGFGYIGGSETEVELGGDTPTGFVRTTTIPGNLYASFHSTTMFSSLNFRVGARFRLPQTIDIAAPAGQADINFTGTSEIAVGAGVQYIINSDMGIRVNAAFRQILGGVDIRNHAAGSHISDTGLLAGTTADPFVNYSSGWSTLATRVMVEISPWYLITPNIRGVLNGGVGLDLAGSDIQNQANFDAAPRIWWSVNPYAIFNLAGPQHHFQLGLQVYGNNGTWDSQGRRENAQLNWAVPIALVFFL